MTETFNAFECEVMELERNLQKGAQLIDVREYPEFASGRVKGANLIPLGSLEQRHQEINPSQPTFVMCRSGKRGAEALKKLLALGFTDVRNVRGGFEAWKAAGFDFEKDSKAVWSLERQVRFAAGSLVVLGTAFSWLIHPYFIALSAFVGAGLVFAAATDSCTMAMILAKMPWNKDNGAVCETATQRT